MRQERRKLMVKMIKIDSSFKDRLNNALDSKNKKPADLARETKLPQALISQYKAGTAIPRREKLALIASYLQVNPAWLLGFNVPMDLCLSTGDKRCAKIIYKEPLEDRKIKNYSLSSKEQEIILKYRQADQIDKRCILRVLGIRK